MDQNRILEFLEVRNELYNGDQKISDLIELGFSDFIETKEVPLQLLESVSLQDLLFYVESSHVFYLQKKLPEISQSMLSLCQDFGQSHPITLILNHFFHQYYKHLQEHLELEDEKIIPYVNLLVDIENGELEKITYLKLCDRYLLSNFHENHSDTEIDIRIVRKAISEFHPPKNAKSQHRLLINQLRAFELDLQFHSELEEKVLIPKALNLERAIRG